MQICLRKKYLKHISRQKFLSFGSFYLLSSEMFIFCNDIYSKKITINNSFQNVDGN